MNKLLRQFLAECLGTIILVTLGCGVAAVATLSSSKPDIFTIAFGWGIGVVIGSWVAAPVSGGHINPAVTVALATINKFSWKKVPVYLIGQYLGAFIGAGIVYGTYYQGIAELEHDAKLLAYENNRTFDKVITSGGIFSTFPKDYLTVGGALTDQMVSVALLMVAVLAITNERGIHLAKQYQPFACGLVIHVLIVCFGQNCGAPLNPARDVSPRVFSAIAGYGWEVFKPLEWHYWWAGGLVGPHLGAIIGAWIYMIVVGMHFTEEDVIENSECGDSSLTNATLSTILKRDAMQKDMLSEKARQVINESMSLPSLVRQARF